jgi:hypothetical protein
LGSVKILGEFQQFANSVTGLQEALPFPQLHTLFPFVHYSQSIDRDEDERENRRKVKGKSFLTNNWAREQITTGNEQHLNTARWN